MKLVTSTFRFLFLLVAVLAFAEYASAQALQINATTLPDGVVGVTYPSRALTATGGTPPYGAALADCADPNVAHWCVISGTLPPGTMQLSTDGIVSGTPTAAGRFDFVVRVTDSGNTPPTTPTRQTADRLFSILVANPLDITTTSLPNGTFGSPYSQTLNFTGGTTPNNWTTIAGALPPGLNLSTGGTISGTPTSSGIFTFTVRVVDSSSPTQSDTQVLSITVPLVVTTTSLPNANVATAYSPQTLTASAGGATPYTWSVTAGALPGGLTLSAAGVIAGTPNTAGSFNFTVGVSDSTPGPGGPLTGSKPLTINVANFVITTATLPDGTFGAAYPQQILATAGGTLPNTWTTIIGALPPGLNLSTNGTITGTPTSSGRFSFTVRAVDSSSPALSATKDLTLAILPQITTTSLPNAVLGSAYSQTLTASPGTAPFTFSVPANTLPPGLTLSAAGLIDGTPTSSGPYNFTVSLTDSSSPPLTSSKPLSINVTNFAITTASLPDGTFGVAYPQQTLTTGGGTLPNSWAIIIGALPSGLNLGATNGTITGTPTNSGRFSFTVRAVDSSNPALSATKDLTLAILPQITTTSLPNAAVGVAYNQQLTASPGTAPFTWSATPGTLPPGLTISGTGVIDGTPTTSGTFNPTIVLSDGSAPPLSTSKPLTIVTQDPLAITTASPLPTGVAGSFYTQQFAASGPSPVSWTVASGTLPPGLSLSTFGALTGQPLNFPQMYVFSVQASGGNPVQTTQKTFAVTINPALSITTSVLAPVTRGATFSFPLAAAGGIGPYTWSSLIPLPQGVALSLNGVLSGSSPNTGSFPLSIQVADNSATPQTASKPLTLTVTSVLTISTTILPDGEVGKNYSQTLTAAAGTLPLSWSVQSGALPAGINLLTDGTLTGIPAPTAAGTYDFTVAVNDSSSPIQIATKLLTLKIQGPLEITTSNPLPTGVVGVNYQKQIESTSTQTSLTWTVSSGGLPPGINLLPTTGNLSGQPTASGTFDFTLKVDGTNPVQTAQKPFRITVNDRLTITTLPALPDGSLSADYSQTLLATGGVQPYTWSNPGGGLPPGLTLSSTTGVLSGRPQGTGLYQFTIQVDDSFTPTQTVRVNNFSLRVNNSVKITTDSLPHAFPDLQYSKQLLADGGTGPFTWVISSGTLPTGITFSTGGLLSGIAKVAESKPITVTVTDAQRISASRDFDFVVDPPVPTLSAPGLPASIVPASASSVAFELASPFPSPLTGKLVLTFTSKAEVPADDPMTRFSTGTRSVPFTIPANTTSAVLDPVTVSLTAGTVAGTVRLAANFDNGPQDVTVATTEISNTAPQITNVVAVRTGQGLEVQITGYAPARRVLSAEFTFVLNVGGKTQPPQTVVANVGPSFAAWFTSPTSIQFGGSFSFVQSFDYTGGNVNDVQSVTVRLTNAQGSTASQVISFK